MDEQRRIGLIISPMGIGEVLDSGFTLGRRNFRLLASIAAWGILPAYLLQGLAAASVSLGTDEGRIVGVVARVAAYLIAIVTAGIAGLAVAVGCDWIISPGHAPSRISVGAAFHVAIRRFFPALFLGIMLVLSAVLWIIPPLGFWIWMRWSPAFAGIVVEDLGPISALGRAWSLTRGAWWHTTGVVVLAAIAVGVVQSAVGGVFAVIVLGVVAGLGMPILASILSSALNGAISVIATPFSTAIAVVLYYELRARSEGFDLEQRLMQDAPLA